MSLQRLFLFSKKSNFGILDIQISRRHQVPKHETRNTFHGITFYISQSVNEISPVYITLQKRIIKKFDKNCDLKTSSRPFCVCRELSTTLNEIVEASYSY